MVQRGLPDAIVNVSSQASVVTLPEHSLQCIQSWPRYAEQIDGCRTGSLREYCQFHCSIDCYEKIWLAKAGPMMVCIPVGRFAKRRCDFVLTQ